MNTKDLLKEDEDHSRAVFSLWSEVQVSFGFTSKELLSLPPPSLCPPISHPQSVPCGSGTGSLQRTPKPHFQQQWKEISDFNQCLNACMIIVFQQLIASKTVVVCIMHGFQLKTQKLARFVLSTFSIKYFLPPSVTNIISVYAAVSFECVCAVSPNRLKVSWMAGNSFAPGYLIYFI